MKISPVAFGFGIALLAIGCKSGDSTAPDTTQPATTGAAAGTTTGAATTAGTTTTASATGFAPVGAILTANCMPCHNSTNKKGGADFSSYETVMKAGVVVAGDSAKSKMVSVVSPGGKPHMPPKKTLSDADIKTISDWIKAGAKES